MTLTELLGQSGFAVTAVANVVEALKQISSETYDVLLSDLHMPRDGDGLTVVSAMRKANPSAVTLLWSASPQMEAAAQAIVLQADEILSVSMDLTLLLDVIKTAGGYWTGSQSSAGGCGFNSRPGYPRGHSGVV